MNEKLLYITHRACFWLALGCFCGLPIGIVLDARRIGLVNDSFEGSCIAGGIMFAIFTYCTRPTPSGKV